MAETETPAAPAEPKKRTWLQQLFRFSVTVGGGGGLGYLCYYEKLSQNLFAVLFALLVVAFFRLESSAERIFDKWSDKE